VDAHNVVKGYDFPRLAVIPGGSQLSPVSPQFYTPIQLNAVDPRRLIIGAENAVCESRDQGDTVEEIGPSIVVNKGGTIAYGAAGNPDILYVGSGPNIYVRDGPGARSLIRVWSYPGTRNIVGVTVHPRNPNLAFVADNVNVYLTSDAGAHWTNIADF